MHFRLTSFTSPANTTPFLSFPVVFWASLIHQTRNISSPMDLPLATGTHATDKITQASIVLLGLSGISSSQTCSIMTVLTARSRWVVRISCAIYFQVYYSWYPAWYLKFIDRNIIWLDQIMSGRHQGVSIKNTTAENSHSSSNIRVNSMISTFHWTSIPSIVRVR